MMRMHHCLLPCIVLLFLLSSSSVHAHSWVACSDYDIQGTSDEQVFNSAHCRSYARDYPGVSLAFGTDTGYDYKPLNNGGNVCRTPLSSTNAANGYSSLYVGPSSMATYAPGQTVCLAWPSKNHVAATCNNPYIPDHGMKIWINPTPNPTSDPGLNGLSLVKDFGANPSADSFVGFQHCPNFCTNADKSTCSGCFTVPGDLVSGNIYTFVWTWAFNSDTDLYASCFEARISGTPVPTTGPPNPTTSAPMQTTTTTSSPVQTTVSPSTTGMQTTTMYATTANNQAGASDVIRAGEQMPTSVPGTGSFPVYVEYTTGQYPSPTDQRTIVVELYDFAKTTMYGKGTANINPGSGTASISVIINRDLTVGQHYILKIYITRRADYDNPPAGGTPQIDEFEWGVQPAVGADNGAATLRTTTAVVLLWLVMAVVLLLS